jgi:hypothetical protein
MTTQRAHLEQVKVQLQELGNDITTLRDNANYWALFDEFMREYEFGLALETLCDFLLEPTTEPVNREVIKKIDNLHTRMGEADDCVQRLNRKTDSAK